MLSVEGLRKEALVPPSFVSSSDWERLASSIPLIGVINKCQQMPMGLEG